jgi:pimeloyl-ACP methyl ester carboxylesterase
MRPGIFLFGGAAVAASAILLAACGGDDDDDPAASVAANTSRTATATAPSSEPDRVVEVSPGRGLYIRCTGSGSPTVVMEAGDEDTSDSYGFAETEVSEVTRTCVYDRANLGQSDPAPGPRGLTELVGDLEELLANAKIPGPYVLVGTSGGGYITAGYAFSQPRQVAGMVFVETPAPFRDPPRELVEDTDSENPANVERRDYLQVEKDAWAARRRIGDIPVTVITDEPSAAAIREAGSASERRLLRRNVADQRGWLVLSPRAEQIVVHTGHAVEEVNPDLVIDAILEVIEEAR